MTTYESEVYNYDALFGESSCDYPRSLANRPQWICWSPDHNEKKPPRRAFNDPDDPTGTMDCQRSDNWGSFNQARRWSNRFEDFGLGFVLTTNDPYAVVDFDDVRDPETGEVHPVVSETVTEADTYADVSVSGTGVHLVGKGILPDGETSMVVDLSTSEWPKAKTEIFTGGQYVAMSGRQIEGTPSNAHNIQRTIDDALTLQPSSKGKERAEPVEPSELDTEARLSEGVKNSKHLRKLVKWAKRGGEIPEVGYRGDRSRTECKLAFLLAYWFEGDKEAVRRVMDDLNPPKWTDEGEGYHDSVLKAVDIQPDVYEPGRDGPGRPSKELTFDVWLGIDVNGPKSTVELAEFCGYSDRHTRRALEVLENAGVVNYERNGRSGRWIATESEMTTVMDVVDDLNSKDDQWYN